jgi:hypothetical protein
MMLFASYSRADRESIRPLLDDVRALGYDIWLDEQLSGGQVWWDEILAKIRGCDAFLFIVTPSSVDSEACLLELEYAHALNRAIIPVELTDTDPYVVPTALSKHQIVSYGSGDKSAMISVSRALTKVDAARPLPDPEPAPPPLPGSYFTTLRDEVTGRDTLTLEQQLGVLHRLRLKSDDDTARTEVRQLLRTFRGRDDLYASVAEQIDALRDSLRPAPESTTETAPPRARSQFRSPAAMIDWLVIILGASALLAGVVALFGSLYSDDAGAIGWGRRGDLIRRWQLVAVLAAFAALVVVNLAGTPRVRKVSSLLVLGVALTSLVWWWWGAVSDLLAQTYISVETISLGGGLIFTGISLGLQIAVGLLMFTAAFPLAAERSAANRAP